MSSRQTREYITNREKIIEELAYMRAKIIYGDEVIVPDLELLLQLVDKYSGILNKATLNDIRDKAAKVFLALEDNSAARESLGR